jgi:hypothetical protein
VSGWRGAWGLWAAVTLLAIPASAVFWFVGGMASCGEEVYDTPPGSTGDTLCQKLVEPVVPWLLLAALPFVIALAGGFVGIRRRNSRLFTAALTAPFVLVVVGVLATLVFM